MNKLKTTEGRCLLFSTAMLLNVEPEAILKWLGVSDIEITNRQMQRGVHIMEMQDYARSINYALVEYQMRPVLATVGEVKVRYRPWETHDGLWIGLTRAGSKHAVAWSCAEQVEYNPTSSEIVGYETFYSLVRI